MLANISITSYGFLYIEQINTIFNSMNVCHAHTGQEKMRNWGNYTSELRSFLQSKSYTLTWKIKFFFYKKKIKKNLLFYLSVLQSELHNQYSLQYFLRAIAGYEWDNLLDSWEWDK